MWCPKWDKRSELAVKYCCPSAAATVVRLPAFCQLLPDCQLANLSRWAGEIALPRKLGALDGRVLSDVSFEGSAIIRAGGVDTPIAAGHTRYGTDEMDFDPVCVDDCRTVVHGARRSWWRRFTAVHVSWVIVGAIELVYWNVWAACTPLVIGSGKTVPVDGAEVCTSYSDPHDHVVYDGSLGSITAYFLSHGLLRLVLRITDPGAPPLLPTFTVSVLSMSFTGVLTYWLVVGLYQSIHFYQAAMERQTQSGATGDAALPCRT